MKHFKLSKEFAEKWLKALRSGEYEQFKGSLVKSNYDHDYEEFANHKLEINYKCACCLGVAAVMLGGENVELAKRTLPTGLPGDYLENIKYPQELLEEGSWNNNHRKESLYNILSTLNDGYTTDIIERIQDDYPDIKFKPVEDLQKINYSFEEIANWIEENVEFYEK